MGTLLSRHNKNAKPFVSPKKADVKDENERYRDISWMMSHVDVPSVLDRLGVRAVKRRGSQIIAYCPEHYKNTGHEQSHPKWEVNVETGQTRCWTEDHGSNLVYVVQRINGFSTPREAERWMTGLGDDKNDVMRLTRVSSMIASMTPKEEEGKDIRFIASFEDKFKTSNVDESGYHFFMAPPNKKPTNIKRSTVDHFRVHQQKVGYYADRVLIPVFQEGKYRGFSAVDILGENGWYKKHPSAKPDSYKKVLFPDNMGTGSLLFGYDEVGKSDSIIITEGAREVMKLWQEGFKNTVAVFGKSISAKQIELLSRLTFGGKAYVMLDGDAAGRQGALKISAKLARQFKVFIVNLPDGIDPKQLSHKDIGFYLKEAKEFKPS